MIVVRYVFQSPVINYGSNQNGVPSAPNVIGIHKESNFSKAFGVDITLLLALCFHRALLRVSKGSCMKTSFPTLHAFSFYTSCFLKIDIQRRTFHLPASSETRERGQSLPLTNPEGEASDIVYQF